MNVNKGFTLVEILIGLVFLVVGLLAIGSLQVTSIRGNSFSHHLTQATYIAQDRLEFLKELPFGSPLLIANDYNDQRVTVSGIVFNGGYTVTEIGNVKTLIYSVTWNDGANHRITFSTIRSQ